MSDYFFFYVVHMLSDIGLDDRFPGYMSFCIKYVVFSCEIDGL